MSLELEDIEELDKVVEIVEKNGKRYIDDEEILIELKLVTLGNFLIKMFLFLCTLVGVLSFLPSFDYKNPIMYIMIVTFLYIFAMIINMFINIYKHKLYITKNHFITYRSVKVHKNDISFIVVRTGGGAGIFGKQWKFYSNEFFICDYYESNNFDEPNFRDIIYKISKNSYFYKDPITYDYENMMYLSKNTKIKLIEKGEQ